MTALRPGQSPPPVRTPIRIVLHSSLTAGRARPAALAGEVGRSGPTTLSGGPCAPGLSLGGLWDDPTVSGPAVPGRAPVVAAAGRGLRADQPAERWVACAYDLLHRRAQRRRR